jgi:hypothetical protein
MEKKAQLFGVDLGGLADERIQCVKERAALYEKFLCAALSSVCSPVSDGDGGAVYPNLGKVRYIIADLADKMLDEFQEFVSREVEIQSDIQSETEDDAEFVKKN